MGFANLSRDSFSDSKHSTLELCAMRFDVDEAQQWHGLMQSNEIARMFAKVGQGKLGI